MVASFHPLLQLLMRLLSQRKDSFSPIVTRITVAVAVASATVASSSTALVFASVSKSILSYSSPPIVAPLFFKQN